MPIKILVIIPCYNEEEALPRLLDELNDTTLPQEYSFVPVVINDCSLDNTAQVAKGKGVIVLSLTNNLGIGGAVQTGIKYAALHDFDYVLQMDGDGQHPPSEMYKFIAASADTQADVVIGSRFLDKKGFQTSFVRRRGIKYFHRINQLLTGKNIYDSTSGFRLLGRKAIKLASVYYPDDYPEPESLVFFSRAGLNIIEIPVVMRERLGGKSTIGRFSSVYYMVKVTMGMFLSYIRKF